MLKYTAIILWVFSLSACAQQRNKPNIPHYKTNIATTYSMPKILKEISGIAFTKNNDSLIYAEQDEIGNIYQYNVVSDKTMLYCTMGQREDFEDIVAIDSIHFYLLRSDGNLFFMEKSNAITATFKTFKNWVPKAEYEGLCYQEKTNSLFILTKSATRDQQQLFIYQIKLNENKQPSSSTIITINMNQWKEKITQNFLPFKPSAIAYNQLDNQWYILSSINHMLLVLDKNWQLLDYAMLDPEQYPQPEGLSFDSHANLWIASEANNQKHGKIYKIERK